MTNLTQTRKNIAKMMENKTVTFAQRQEAQKQNLIASMKKAGYSEVEIQAFLSKK